MGWGEKAEGGGREQEEEPEGRGSFGMSERRDSRNGLLLIDFMQT